MTKIESLPIPKIRDRLAAAAQLRIRGEQMLAQAKQLEVLEAEKLKERIARDHRLIGEIAIGIAETDEALAAAIVRGVDSLPMSDRKYLARTTSPMEKLRQLIGQAPILDDDVKGVPVLDDTPAEAPLEHPAGPDPVFHETAWFDVPYDQRDVVPTGLHYDRESKLRFASNVDLVQAMMALGYEPQVGPSGRLPPPATA